jgi:hypothetical protein
MAEINEECLLDNVKSPVSQQKQMAEIWIVGALTDWLP